MSAFAVRMIETFRAARQGLPRLSARVIGKGAEAKVGELLIYDVIGADMWTGGGVTAKAVADHLAQLKKDGCTALNIFVNSPGGDVFEAVAIYNQLKRFEGKKTVCVDGLAASAASLIALVGDEVHTAANAMWMIHNPWGFAMGDANDLRKTADTLEQVGSVLVQTYQAKTKQTEAQLKSWMDDETWMTAQEALLRGFTDKVLADEEPAAAAAPEAQEAQAALAAAGLPILGRYRNTPQNLRDEATSSRSLIISLEKKLNGRRASPAATTAGLPA